MDIIIQDKDTIFDSNTENVVQKIHTEDLKNPLLKRLIEEVRNENASNSSVDRYNRVHNRHNRGR